MNFNLGAPKMLWLLLIVLPPLIFFLWWAWRKRQQLVTQFISARLLGTLKVGVSPSRQKLRMALLVAAVALLILSLARPQWGYTMEEVKQRGLDIIVAIDTSNSMLAEDVPPSRLARAKLAALDLMRRAKTDRLGLIAFAGDAFLVCPLTLDDAAFGQSVDSLDTHSISQGGTAIAEAIATAQKAFKDEAENHKALVLFTDGEDHDGGAVKAAEEAAKDGMRIYTIGIGSPEGETLRIRDERGRIEPIRDEAGNPVISKLNETLLQDIANASGGFYQPLRGSQTVETLYGHPRGLGSLPKTTSATKSLRRYHERYHWLVALAVVLLLVEMFLPDRKLRRSKAVAKTLASAPSVAAETVALLLLFLLPMPVLAGPGRALREYEAGKYEDALKDYQQSLENKKDDPRLNFNAGTAAYQSRHLEDAANSFNQALASPDLKLQERAYYNLGNTYYRLGQKPPASPKQGAPPGGMDIDAAKKAWEQAIQHYDSALKLNPQDEDAKFNRAFVQRMLEELKKQQQQQQQSNDKSGDKDKSKQDQSKDQSKNDEKKDQDKQQQSQQKKDQQQKDSQSQNQKQDSQQSDQNKQDKQDDKQSQAQKQKEDEEKKKQQAQNQSEKPDDDKSKEEAREAAMMAAGQMTPQQAQQMLDAEKSDDQVLKLAPQEKQTSRSRTVQKLVT